MSVSKFIECDPPIESYNPQRGDAGSPFLHLKDYQQCMGNSFQNVWWWIAKLFPTLIGFPLTREGTYAYYHALEAWMKQTGKTWGIYNSDIHTEFLMLAINELHLPVKMKSDDASFDSIVSVFDDERAPVILGTRFTGPGGHIVTVIGANDDELLLSDPYGNPKTGYSNQDGWRVTVSRDFCKGKLSKMIWPEVG